DTASVDDVIARSEATKQSRLSPWKKSGLLRFAGNDDLIEHDSAFSRRISSEFCFRHRPENERAQGMPGAGRNPWPASKKKSWRQSPQVQPKHPAFPARWF